MQWPKLATLGIGHVEAAPRYGVSDGHATSPWTHGLPSAIRFTYQPKPYQWRLSPLDAVMPDDDRRDLDEGSLLIVW